MKHELRIPATPKSKKKKEEKKKKEKKKVPLIESYLQEWGMNLSPAKSAFLPVTRKHMSDLKLFLQGQDTERV